MALALVVSRSVYPEVLLAVVLCSLTLRLLCRVYYQESTKRCFHTHLRSMSPTYFPANFLEVVRS
jgi:hypothetical protein